MLRRNYIVPLLWLVVLVLTSGTFFFWDTVQLASKQASFYYDNGFQSFFLPEEINSGHPPFYGIALASTWLLLGKTLLISHLFNAVFVLAYIFQAQRLGDYFLGAKKAYILPLVLFMNPVFLGHSILVSPDNALIFLLLLAANGLLRSKVKWTAVACFFLAILSMRGMMVVASIFIAEILFYALHKRSVSLRIILKYVPAGLAAATFLGTHYLYQNWLGFHKDSPWQESFSQVSMMEYFRNLFIIAWRLVDFGNIFVWAGILNLVLRRKEHFPHKFLFLSFFISCGLIFALPLASFKFLTAHRYFIPLHLLISVVFAVWAVKFKMPRVIFATVLIALFAGHFWIYQREISQGWDVSLGHVPIYSLMEEMHDYVKEENIDLKEIGTEFPLKSAARNLYLSDEKASFKEGVIGRDKYILYSKITNDYKDSDYLKLERDYNLVHELSSFRIDLKLYEKRP